MKNLFLDLDFPLPTAANSIWPEPSRAMAELIKYFVNTLYSFHYVDGALIKTFECRDEQ